MNSYLLYGPNNALRTIIATPELQFHISDHKGKIVQNIKFLSVNQTSDLMSKLDLTHQHESRDMLGFQNKDSNTKLLKIHAETIRLTLKNVIFNGGLFSKCEATIRFVALKQV